MRSATLCLLLGLLLPNNSEAEEKLLFVVHSNYLANTTVDWKRSIEAGSTMLAVTSDGKSVTVTKDNLQEVVADIATQEEEPKALRKDLEALGYEAMSKQEYDRHKHTKPIVAVTVNNVVGAVPGMGYVFFGKDFVSPDDLRDADKVARVSKIDWSDARVAVGGEMTRQYDGPGTREFRAKLEKLLRETGRNLPGVSSSSEDAEASHPYRARTVTLGHERITLAQSLRALSDQGGVPIQVNDEDLQQEGITKNQSFVPDVYERPFLEAIHHILRKANPEGKLVCVLRQVGGKDVIVITTKAAAQRRSEMVMPMPRRASVPEAQEGPSTNDKDQSSNEPSPVMKTRGTLRQQELETLREKPVSQLTDEEKTKLVWKFLSKEKEQRIKKTWEKRSQEQSERNRTAAERMEKIKQENTDGRGLGAEHERTITIEANPR